MAARSPRSERPSQIARASPEYAAAVTALGRRVRALREARGLTLEKASEAMDLDLTHLQKIEAGRLNVTMVTLVRIAAGLGVPLEALFEMEMRRRGAK